jgi:hypothetical protein
MTDGQALETGDTGHVMKTICGVVRNVQEQTRRKSATPLYVIIQTLLLPVWLIRWRLGIQRNPNARMLIGYSFVVEEFDIHSNKEVVAVEMWANLATGFIGKLSEGDEVAFYDQERSPADIVVTKALRNLTNGSIFGDRSLVVRNKVLVPGR